MAKKQDYSKLLKDPRWIKKRNEILTRDSNTCQFCGANDRYMHVHHKNYQQGKMPWEYEDNELITICDKCHEYVTEDSRDLYENFLYVRNMMRKFGFSDSVLNSILHNVGELFEDNFEYEPIYFNDIIHLVDYSVCGIQYYDDFRILAKLGILHENLISKDLPFFYDDYKRIITKFLKK